MKCPKCNITLLMSEKQGIEIDYCPDCRGIWLDRGELEKIIERTASMEVGSDQQSRPLRDEHYKNHDGHYDHDDHDNRYGYKHGRRRNFLSELFD